MTTTLLYCLCSCRYYTAALLVLLFLLTGFLALFVSIRPLSFPASLTPHFQSCYIRLRLKFQPPLLVPTIRPQTYIQFLNVDKGGIYALFVQGLIYQQNYMAWFLANQWWLQDTSIHQYCCQSGDQTELHNQTAYIQCGIVAGSCVKYKEKEMMGIELARMNVGLMTV